MSSILILGGSGYQGSNAARILAGQPEIERLILVDRDLAAVERIAEQLGGSIDIDIDTVDVRDRSAVTELLKRQKPSTVLNCAGPFRIVGADSAAAAIEAGVNYVDILDDSQVVPDYVALQDSAVAKGVTVIFGAGFTPGLTNIIGRLLAEDLDEVEQIHWSYLVNPTLAVAPHLMTHRVQMFAADSLVIEDGKQKILPGGSLPVQIDWQGVGQFKAAVCTHPEPLMAQRYFPGLQRASIRGSYTAPSFLDLLTILGNANMGSADAFQHEGRDVRPDRLIGDFLGSDTFKSSTIWADVLKAEKDYGPVDGVRVAVRGQLNGAVVGRVLEYVSRERWLTTHGVAAAVAGLIAAGTVRSPGVHSAEVIDPSVIVPALGAVGINLGQFQESDAPEFAASA
jgi:saccharopine dehydrogenase-like NADP-dependent oxidoreductase